MTQSLAENNEILGFGSLRSFIRNRKLGPELDGHH